MNQSQFKYLCLVHYLATLGYILDAISCSCTSTVLPPGMKVTLVSSKSSFECVWLGLVCKQFCEQFCEQRNASRIITIAFAGNVISSRSG